MSEFSLKIDLSEFKKRWEASKKLLFLNLSKGGGYWRRFSGSSKTFKKNKRRGL